MKMQPAYEWVYGCVSRTGQAVNRIRAVVGKYKKETNKIPNSKNKSDSAWKSEYGVEISKRLAVPENLGCVALLACQNKRERKKRIGMWWEMG